MESKNNSGLGFLIFAGVLFGLYLILKDRNPAGGMALRTYEPEMETVPNSSIRYVAAPVEPTEGKRYRNEETWNIEWTPDGLPSKVTIHRDAVQT